MNSILKTSLAILCTSPTLAALDQMAIKYNADDDHYVISCFGYTGRSFYLLHSPGLSGWFFTEHMSLGEGSQILFNVHSNADRDFFQITSFVDLDQDFMPDYLEKMIMEGTGGGITIFDIDATQDHDGDGLIDIDEFLNYYGHDLDPSKQDHPDVGFQLFTVLE